MSKEVIVNHCFGGYRWSNMGVYAYVKRKNMHGVKFCADIYPKPGCGETIDISAEEYCRIAKSLDDGERRCGPYGVYVSSIYAIDNDGNTWDGHSIPRDDEDAIHILQSLGSEYCSADCADLAIESYDDELFDWGIDEYDGLESLELIPKLNEERIRACKSVDEIISLLRSMRVIH